MTYSRNAIYTRIVNAIRAVYPNTYCTSRLVAKPSTFPACYIHEIDRNRPLQYTQLDFQDVQYVSLVSSYNYGLDINSAYIVLSKEEIKGKHLASTFSPKKQIVIRVSRKNYSWLKNALQPLSIQNYMLGRFEDFRQMVIKGNINLKRGDGENGCVWEFL